MILLYIDPGAGSLLIQLLIAGLLGSVAFFGRIRQSIRTIFDKLFGKNRENDI